MNKIIKICMMLATFLIGFMVLSGCDKKDAFKVISVSSSTDNKTQNYASEKNIGSKSAESKNTDSKNAGGESTESINTDSENIESGSIENKNTDSGNVQDAEKKTAGVTETAVSPRYAYVYVCGAVKKPGVYKLSFDDRVDDALNAAGGWTDKASEEYINLAEMVIDGEEIYFPTQDEVETGKVNKNLQLSKNRMADINEKNIGENSNDGNRDGEKSFSPDSENSKVNINTATEDELMTLPGIGSSKAADIMAYRQEHGEFNSTDELMQISGIKEAVYSKIKSLITVK